MSEFDWIRARFDKVDEDNRDIKIETKAIRETVDRHSTYWSIAKWALGGAAGLIASILASLGMSKH